MTLKSQSGSAQMYLSGSLGVVFSRVMGMGAGVLSLWFLTRILSTEAFAGYMLAMSLVFVLGSATCFGFDRVMLLRIGTLSPEPGRLQGGGMARRIALYVAALSLGTALMALTILNAAPVLSAQNDLALWFRVLMPMVPAIALTTVLVTWLQSNHVVGRPQSIPGQVDGLRCAGFGVAYASGLGAWAVPVVAIAAAILPPSILAARSAKRAQSEPADFALRDVHDGISFFAMRLAALGFLHADILILGILAPAQEVAAYVVASRFALILYAGQQVFAPAYAPRARRHVQAGASHEAAREYHVARIFGILVTMAAGLGYVVLGQPLLDMFGPFEGAYGVLLILGAGYLILVGAGLHSVHLSMTGALRDGVLTQVGSFVCFILLLLILVPRFGAIGAASSFLIAQGIFAASGLFCLARQGIVPPIPWPDMVAYMGAVGALVLAGFGPELRWIGAGLLLIAFGGTAWRHRPLLRETINGIWGKTL